MSKGNKGFGSSLTDGLDDIESLDNDTPAEGVMASRSQTLARIASGKMVTDRTEWVDPARCRPWRLHNRDLEYLNEETCRDLIDAFLSAKKQRIPAIVRRLQNDPDHDYEIIAGVRRWWTVNWLRQHHYPDFEYLVTTQHVSDEEAFLISDIENRSRKDITDWERAKEYTRALAEFYNGSQSEMAQHLKITASWLSRLLDVARLPNSIVSAFAHPHEITVRVARDIKPLTADPRALERMGLEASRIAAERAESEEPMRGPDVAKRLMRAAAEPAKKSGGETEIVSSYGKPMIRYQRGRGGALTIKVAAKSGADKKEVLAAIERILTIQ